jgi:hypothetical protein
MVSQYLQLFKWQFEEENTLFEYYDKNCQFTSDY